MQDTLSPDLARLLDRAKMHVLEDGVMPLDVAAELMGYGMDVYRLERKWRSEGEQ